jgi:hypothetical protein
MWRIIILLLILVVIIAQFIFRPSKVLKVVVKIIYSQVSPLRRSGIPLWASYYLGDTMYEAPPEQIKQLEENVRVIGYAMLAAPVTLLVIVLAL